MINNHIFRNERGEGNWRIHEFLDRFIAFYSAKEKPVPVQKREVDGSQQPVTAAFVQDEAGGQIIPIARNHLDG
jgi:hypothetical protein